MTTVVLYCYRYLHIAVKVHNILQNNINKKAGDSKISGVDKMEKEGEVRQK